jgi:hypothetical protein
MMLREHALSTPTPFRKVLPPLQIPRYPPRPFPVIHTADVAKIVTASLLTRSIHSGMMLTTMQVAERLRVPFWQIKYAHKCGAVALPQQVAGRYVYGPEDVARLQAYFKSGRRRYSRRKGQPDQGGVV